MKKPEYTPVVFFLGPGGVGKSTVSAIKAVDSALKSKKVLIATFDPSPRLKDILANSSGFSNKNLRTNLDVFVLSSKEIFEELLGQVDLLTAESIKSNKLFKHLIERIQGVQEFSSLYFLSEKVKLEKYDLIIIDTPPLQNSLDFFSSPQKLKDLFESAIVKLFIGDFSQNWFEIFFKKTREIAFTTLKKLTGIEFFDQLISLMKALEKLQPIILKTIHESQNILFSETTEYCFVTSYEVKNLESLNEHLEKTKEIGIQVKSIYVNKYESVREDDWIDLQNRSGQNKLHLLYLFCKNKIRDQKIKLKILNRIHEKYNLKIFTVGLFGKMEIEESDLVVKSGDVHELKF